MNCEILRIMKYKIIKNKIIKNKKQSKYTLDCFFVKNCAQFFTLNYAFIAFNFFAKLDFFLAAVFFTITPLLQA